MRVRIVSLPHGLWSVQTARGWFWPIWIEFDCYGSKDIALQVAYALKNPTIITVD